MPVPLVGATVVIGGAVLGAVAGIVGKIASDAGHAVDRSPSASWGSPPEASSNVADTMVEPTNYEQMQHKTMNIPGARIRVRGTVDSHETLAKLRAGVGDDHHFNDMRGNLNSSTIDEMLSRRAQ
jgi:hypothetical protein